MRATPSIYRSVMKSLFSCFCGILMVASVARGQTIPLYENFGNITSITNTPQIDALAFANYGVFAAYLYSIPYDFQNTRNFTNRGSMSGYPGYRFDTVPSIGFRKPAAVFNNQVGGVVRGLDYRQVSFLLNASDGTTITASLVQYPSQININADKVINRGTLEVGAAGIIKIKGGEVDLSRSGILVDTLASSFTRNTPTNFIPDTTIADNYWGQTNQFMDTSAIIAPFSTNNFQITSPRHFVQSQPSTRNGFRFFGSQQLSIVPSYSAVYTNALDSTNMIIQGVFVAFTNPGFGASATFHRSTVGTNLFKTVKVRLSKSSTNIVTGGLITDDIYFVDRTASESNSLAANLITFPNTYKPDAYEVSRSNPFGYGAAISANSQVVSNLYFDSATFSNAFVTNFYNAYSCNVDYIPDHTGTPLPNGLDAPLPGRVEITAGSVNLSGARIRAQTSVSVNAQHIVTDTNTAVVSALDASSLFLDLGSTNGLLSLKNVVPISADRVSGDIYAYSAIWTNFQTQILSTTNIAPDPMNTNQMATNVVSVTNTINIGYALTIIDADLLGSQPTVITDLSLRSTNVVVADGITIGRNFLLTGTALTVDRSISMPGSSQNWIGTNSPNLLNYTNNGFVTMGNLFVMGPDRPLPLNNFVLRGTNTSAAAQIRTKNAQLGGKLQTQGDTVLYADVAELSNGTIVAGGNGVSGSVGLFVGDLKMLNYRITAAHLFTLAASNSIADAGLSASNLIVTASGFSLPIKPKKGALLGTTLQASADNGAAIEHIWAGEDMGAVAAGYANNGAIGKLSLSRSANGIHVFHAPENALPGTKYALYVDYLNLGAGIGSDVESALALDPNFTIYFADSNIPVEQLDNRLNGHLRWVKTFAGPFSGIPVNLTGGGVVIVNRGFRNSLNIDSDADGIPNGIDLDIFSGTQIKRYKLLSAPARVVFGFDAAPNTTYTIDSSTTPNTPSSWSFDSTVANTNSTVVEINITNSIPAGVVPKFYRVNYKP